MMQEVNSQGCDERKNDDGEYGSSYWCIKVTPEVLSAGEIFAYADNVFVSHKGALHLEHAVNEGDLKLHYTQETLIIAPGQWIAVFAASDEDGSLSNIWSHSAHWSELVTQYRRQATW